MAEKEELLPQSMIRKVQAPDGSTFDMMRQEPGARGPGEEGSAELRGNALVDMKAIAERGEPELLSDLNRQHISYEYLSSSAISHSRKPDVKADLVRVAVRERIAEGDRSGAVEMLAYSNAVELDLPEYGEDFVLKQYNLSLYGNLEAAWHIAREVFRAGDRIFKPKDEDDRKRIQSEWAEREEQTFKDYAELTIAQARMPGVTEATCFDIRSIFWEMRDRKDGFNSENPSELSRRVAEAMVEIDLKTEGREWMAPIDAADAGMPDDYIAELKKKVDPNDINSTRNWFARFREKLGRALGKS